MIERHFAFEIPFVVGVGGDPLLVSKSPSLGATSVRIGSTFFVRRAGNYNEAGSHCDRRFAPTFSRRKNLVFDKQGQAQQGLNDLVASGFPANDVHLSQSETIDQTNRPSTRSDESFGSGIKSFFIEIFSSSRRDDVELYSGSRETWEPCPDGQRSG